MAIRHLSSFKPEQQEQVLANLAQYDITEKLDGAQILFGVDDIGFYTSRETKGGKRIYDVTDYPFDFQYTYMRSVHTVIQHLLAKLDLKIGTQIEAEILFDEVPNVVPYSDNLNYIIPIRVTEGSCDLEELVKSTHPGNSIRSYSFEIDVPVTYDGIRIEKVHVVHIWRFGSMPTLKVSREQLEDPLFIPSLHSAYGPSYGWIEGIVLSRNGIPEYKITNKERFDRERIATWATRNTLIAPARTGNIESRNLSVMGRLTVKLGDVLGNATMGSMRAKTELRDMGNTRDERHLELEEDTKFTMGYGIAKIPGVKANMIHYLEEARDELKKKLNSESHSIRDLEVFASLFARIEQDLLSVSIATSIRELWEILLSKKLDDLDREVKL